MALAGAPAAAELGIRLIAAAKGRHDGRGMGTRSHGLRLGARGGPLGGAERNLAADARSDGRSGLPELHGVFPQIRGARLGKSFTEPGNRDDGRADRGAHLRRDDPRSTSFVLTAIGLAIVIVGVLIVSNAWKTPNYNVIARLGPRRHSGGLGAGRKRYFRSTRSSSWSPGRRSPCSSWRSSTSRSDPQIPSPACPGAPHHRRVVT